MPVQFNYSSELHSLQSLVSQVMSKEWSFDQVRTAEQSDGYGESLWRALASVGITGLLLESDGLDGSGAWEIAVVSEELGRGLGLVPFAWSSVFAASVINDAAASDTRTMLLESLAADEIAVPVAPRPHHLADVAVGFTGVGAAGPRWSAPFGKHARWILRGVESTAERISLDVVDTNRLQSPLVTERRSDLHAIARIDSAGMASGSVGRLEISVGEWMRAHARTKLAHAAYALGAQEAVVEMAAAYASARHQFGRPIGSFQAVSHRCADMWARVTSDRISVAHAAWTLEMGDADEPLRSCGFAKARATAGLSDATSSALQIFGGHGFAAEANIQLFYRHGQGLEVIWGAPSAEFSAAATLRPKSRTEVPEIREASA